MKVGAQDETELENYIEELTVRVAQDTEYKLFMKEWEETLDEVHAHGTLDPNVDYLKIDPKTLEILI